MKRATENNGNHTVKLTEASLTVQKYDFTKVRFIGEHIKIIINIIPNIKWLITIKVAPEIGPSMTRRF